MATLSIVMVVFAQSNEMKSLAHACNLNGNIRHSQYSKIIDRKVTFKINLFEKVSLESKNSQILTHIELPKL